MPVTTFLDLSRRAAAAVGAAAALCCAVTSANATVLMYPYPNEAPSFNFREYAQGNPGVLSTGYGPLTLTSAYRVLGGHPLSVDDLKMLAAVPSPLDAHWEARETWNKARNDVLGQPQAGSGGGTDDNPLCADDGFAQAAKSLAGFVQTYGASDDWVRDWTQAQVVVFSNCGSGHAAHLPAAAPAGAPAWLVQARAYQRAAAQFYARRFEAAATGFDAIAQDPASPYRTISAYLASRARLEQAVRLPDDTRGTALSATADALGQQQAGAAPAQQANLRALERRARFQADPEAELRRIEDRIANQPWDADTLQDLKDYIYALNLDAQPNNGLHRRPVIDAVPRGGLTDWLATMQADPAPAGGSARVAGETVTGAAALWRSSNSVAWLVATLQAAPSLHALPVDVLDAATAVTPRSPAFAAIQYRLLKLRDANIAVQRAAGKNTATLDAAICHDAEQLLAHHADRFPGRDANLLHQLWAEHTASPAVFMQQIWMHAPSEVDLGKDAAADGGGDGIPYEFADLMNERLSVDDLETLWKASAAATAGSPTARAHAELSAMLFVRAALLQRDDVAKRIAPELKTLRPKLAGDIDACLDAETADKPYRLTVMLLDDTTLSAIVTDGGWVPYSALTPTLDTSLGAAHGTNGALHPVLFQNAAQRHKAASEVAALRQLKTGVPYMSEALVSHVHRHPFDFGNPAHLAAFVGTTRYASEPKASRAAFRLLHRWYFFTPSARFTKYWY